MHNNIGVVRALVEFGANLELTDVQESTPLIKALITHNVEMSISLYLLKPGVKLDEKLRDDKKTSLHFAVSSVSEAVMHALILFGANVNAVDKYGNTPLHHTTNSIKAQILIGYGANIYATNNYGEWAWNQEMPSCNYEANSFSAKFLKEKLEFLGLLHKEGLHNDIKRIREGDFV